MPRDPDAGDGIDKATLMKLVTQQMVNALLAGGDDDDVDEEAIIAALHKKLRDRERARKIKKKSKRRNSTERRLGQADMPPMMPPTPTECLRPGDEVVMGVRDDDSFAGGDLHGLVHESFRASGPQRWGGSSEEMTKATGASSAGSGGSESMPGSKSVFSGDMSADEIRQYVMDNIPQAVRDQIPVEAWDQIFRPPSFNSKTTGGSDATPASQTHRPPNRATKPQTVTVEIPIGHIEFVDEDLVDDDITVFSDVTGLTGAFPDGKYVEHKREILTQAAPSMAKVEEDISQNSRNNNTFRPKDLPPEAPGEGSTVSGRNSNASRIQQLQARKEAGEKKVCFDQVVVRYYDRIVSDNPSVQSGPGIGIGWKYKRGVRVDVDQWEQARGPARSSAELVLPRHVRERILREAGIPQKEIADMVRATLKVKNQRKQTVNNLPVQGFEETIEKARRRFSKLISLSR
jgi:hypothetical protein